MAKDEMGDVHCYKLNVSWLKKLNYAANQKQLLVNKLVFPCHDVKRKAEHLYKCSASQLLVVLIVQCEPYGTHIIVFNYPHQVIASRYITTQLQLVFKAAIGC